MSSTVSPMRDQYIPPPIGWQRRVARYLGRDWLLGYGLMFPAYGKDEGG